MQTETCPDCGQVVVVALVEPDARPMRFDTTAQTRFRLVNITEQHAVAMPTPVHEQHVLTCHKINNTK